MEIHAQMQALQNIKALHIIPNKPNIPDRLFITIILQILKIT